MTRATAQPPAPAPAGETPREPVTAASSHTWRGTRPREHGPRDAALLVLGCVALAALTLLLPAAPTYDPWSWINWGREVAALDLNTVAGPSWKPLPVIFTTVFSFAGDAAPELWLVVARAGGLLALVMAWRLAARLAGPAAGAVAAAALLLADGWVYTVGLGNSEGLLIAFALLAVERHLDGRLDHAFALAVGAALLRPEAWPFLGAYAVWVWLRRPAARPLVALGLAVVPLLWFLPELWGSGQLLRSSDRAATPDSLSPAFADQPALSVIARAAAVVPVPALIGAVLAVGLAAGTPRRFRSAATLGLGALAGAWLALVALMTQAGFSGNLRYVLLPVAVTCVLGGVGWARLASALAEMARARFGEGRSPRLAGLAVLAVGALSVAPFAPRLAEAAPRELAKLGYEAELYDSLEVAVERAGGPAGVLACGRPVAGPYQVPGLAWRLRAHGIVVGLDAREAGTVFRAPPVRGARREPTLPSGSSRLRTVARAGPWEVHAACRPADGRTDASRRAPFIAERLP